VTKYEFFIKHNQWIFLASLSLLGIGIVFLSTARFGAGVAGDSIHYISVAHNLRNGRGLIDYAGAPLILFPPLFSFIIAGFAWVFRLDAFVAGWVLNALLWGVNIFLSGLFFKRLFTTRPVYFYLSSLFVFLSPSALSMHASVLSDPLFLTFTLLFFLLGQDYIERQSWKSLAGLLLVAGLAPLLRFSGLAHIIAGSLIILYAQRRTLLKGIVLSGLFGVLTSLPVALWIALHNLPLSGTWWGTSNAEGADVRINILQSLRKMMYWFIPYRPFSADGLLEPVLILAVLLLIILVINRTKQWRAWSGVLAHPAMISMWILTVIYYSSTVLNMQTADHKSLFSDRYFVIIFLPVLVQLIVTFDYLILPHLPLPSKWFVPVLCAVFVLWSVYPGYKIYKYVQVSLADGESGYNQYNTRAYHESQVLRQAVILLEKEPEARLYSNIPPLVWFFTRRIMTNPPSLDVPRTKDQIKGEFAGWPGEPPGYYIWLQPDPYKLYMPPSLLSLVADFESLQKLSDGEILRITARKGQ